MKAIVRMMIANTPTTAERIGTAISPLSPVEVLVRTVTFAATSLEVAVKYEKENENEYILNHKHTLMYT